MNKDHTVYQANRGRFAPSDCVETPDGDVAPLANYLGADGMPDIELASVIDLEIDPEDFAQLSKARPPQPWDNERGELEPSAYVGRMRAHDSTDGISEPKIDRDTSSALGHAAAYEITKALFADEIAAIESNPGLSPAKKTRTVREVRAHHVAQQSCRGLRS